MAVLCLCLNGCHRPSDDTGPLPKNTAEATDAFSVPVGICILKQDTFRHQRICNGHAEAYIKSAINVRNGGLVTDIRAAEGNLVRMGDILLTLSEEDMRTELQAALLNFKKSEIALTDRLIDFGCRLADTASIPRETLDVLYVKTGYAESLLHLRQAQANLERCTVRAPFDGKVADLSCRLHEWCQGGCCTLLDDSYMDIRFNLLEHEISMAASGRKVTVMPFHSSANALHGTILSVNPAIDRNGQIGVTARVRNDGSLLDGMQVKVMLWEDLPGQLTVPRDAVAIRDSREVVFRYAGGYSVWTYVNIVATNSTRHAIVPDPDRDARLAEGDTIIISGLSNMGDHTPVHLL